MDDRSLCYIAHSGTLTGHHSQHTVNEAWASQRLCCTENRHGLYTSGHLLLLTSWERHSLGGSFTSAGSVVFTASEGLFRVTIHIRLAFLQRTEAAGSS